MASTLKQLAAEDAAMPQANLNQPERHYLTGNVRNVCSSVSKLGSSKPALELYLSTFSKVPKG